MPNMINTAHMRIRMTAVVAGMLSTIIRSNFHNR